LKGAAETVMKRTTQLILQ